MLVSLHQKAWIDMSHQGMEAGGEEAERGVLDAEVL